MKGLRKAAFVGAALVALALGGLTALGWAQRPDVGIPAGVPGRHIVIEGTPIRYVQRGAGPDVLLVHGSPGSVEDWEPIFERLAPRFRVTAFDRPGHGYSGGVARPHTPSDNASLALGLLRELGMRDVVYVGHSYGGITGLDLALRRPAEVRAFLIVGSRAYPPTDVDALYRLIALPVLGRGVARLLAPMVGPARIESGVRANFAPNLDAIPADFIARRAPLWMRPTVSAALSEERVTLEAALTDMGQRYGEIQAPVVLVCGERDRRSYEDARRLVRQIPGARLVSLAETGHYVQYARPDALVAEIERAAGPGTAAP